MLCRSGGRVLYECYQPLENLCPLLSNTAVCPPACVRTLLGIEAFKTQGGRNAAGDKDLSPSNPTNQGSKYKLKSFPWGIGRTACIKPDSSDDATNKQTYEDAQMKDSGQVPERVSCLVVVAVGRAVFSTYLRSEFSEENLKFWEACEEYKRSPPSQLQSRAKQIYQRFIEADAPNEVNLDALTRDLTKQNLEEMIHILMEKDSYRRFLSSALLKELCQPKDTQGGGEGERAGGA
uniref:RGS domain-containing protein n=1 Tax=Neogobius melanostomus TaxID=47308 RepID=A0A8C6TBG4_9GOBI